MHKDKLKQYGERFAKCKTLERKGKTTPYTPANGQMFSLLNVAGQIGIRFSKEIQKNTSWNLLQPLLNRITKLCIAMYSFPIQCLKISVTKPQIIRVI